MTTQEVQAARRMLDAARRVVVVTGAGMSAESGVPTFRGEDGLWRNHRPEELATPGAFQHDPKLVWQWYRWRRGLVAACEPNAGHRALSAFRARHPETTVVTQNVDGLHQEADRLEGVGPAVSPVLELHGRLFGDRCQGCHRRTEANRTPDPDLDATLPRCDDCGDLLRPDVVWFGEGLPRSVLETAVDAARTADICLVVGTSARVQPAASLPLATTGAGGTIIEVNLSPTPLSRRARVTLRGPSGELLPELLGP